MATKRRKRAQTYGNGGSAVVDGRLKSLVLFDLLGSLWAFVSCDFDLSAGGLAFATAGSERLTGYEGCRSSEDERARHQLHVCAETAIELVVRTEATCKANFFLI